MFVMPGLSSNNSDPDSGTAQLRRDVSLQRFRAREIGDGAGHAQHTVMGAGRQVHAADGHLQRAFAPFIQRADRSWECGIWEL